MEKMIINIDQTGEVQVKVECVKGAACEQVSKAIEDALGDKTSSTKTREYFEQEAKNVAEHRY